MASFTVSSVTYKIPYHNLTIFILDTMYRYLGTFADSEDPNEMPHKAAFHKGMHC